MGDCTDLNRRWGCRLEKYLERNVCRITVTRGIWDWPELRWIPRCLAWTVR